MDAPSTVIEDAVMAVLLAAYQESLVEVHDVVVPVIKNVDVSTPVVRMLEYPEATVSRE